MLETAVIIATVIVLVCSILLYRKAAGEMSPKRINMLSYSFYLLTAHTVVVSVVAIVDVPFWFYDPIVHGPLIGGQAIRIKVWLMVMWALLGIPLGALLLNVWLRVRGMRRLVLGYRTSSPEIGPQISEEGLFTTFVITGAALAIFIGYRILTHGNLPILNILMSGDVVDTQFLRAQSNLTEESKLAEIFSSIFNYGGIHWMSYTAYAVALTSGKPKWWVLFSILLVVSILFVIYTTTITPTLVYLIGFVVIRSLMGKRPVKGYEALVVSMLLVRMFVLFKGSEGSFGEVLRNNVFGRIMMGQMVGLYRAVEVFPQHVDFIWFSSTANALHNILGLPTSPSYGIVTMSFYNPLGVAAGTAGHMTTIFMGEAWANFSYVGVVIAPLWVGMFVQGINLAFLSRRKSAVAIGLYAYLTTVFAYSTDFQSFYYPFGLLLFVLGIAAILTLARVFSGEHQPERASPAARIQSGQHSRQLPSSREERPGPRRR
jgi:hypothetical protein